MNSRPACSKPGCAVRQRRPERTRGGEKKRHDHRMRKVRFDQHSFPVRWLRWEVAGLEQIGCRFSMNAQVAILARSSYGVPRTIRVAIILAGQLAVHHGRHQCRCDHRQHNAVEFHLACMARSYDDETVRHSVRYPLSLNHSPAYMMGYGFVFGQKIRPHHCHNND